MIYYYPQKPMRIYVDSVIFQKVDNDENWIAEIKRNGWRCLAYKENGKLTLYSRHCTVINTPLPIIREYLLKILPDNTIIDGELINNRTKTFKELFYAFDILTLNNILSINKPLSKRRELLESVITGNDKVILPLWYHSNKKELYFNSIDNELNEGIVIKRLDSKYTISLTRCIDVPCWLKVKKGE